MKKRVKMFVINSMVPILISSFICFLGCTRGNIRLLDGNYPFEGRVEVCTGTEWSTVCRRGWDTPDTIVVCRQLGYSTTGKQYKYINNIICPPKLRARLSTIAIIQITHTSRFLVDTAGRFSIHHCNMASSTLEKKM